MRIFFLMVLLALNVEAKVTTETATLAGGCFWGMEEIIRGIPGVLSTQVGYTGGSLKNAGYVQVKTGQTGHAESVSRPLTRRRDRLGLDPRLAVAKMRVWMRPRIS